MMEIMNRQTPATPDETGVMVYAIENLIVPHIPHIPPVSYEMSIEEFRYYKKLYQFKKCLDEMVSIFKESLPEVKAEAGIAGPVVDDVATVKPELSDNCWVLVSPDGQRYIAENLQEWVCENYALLGFPDAEDWKNICKRIRNVARRTVFGKGGPKTFRGWTVEQRPKEKLSNTAHMWTLVSPEGEVIQVYNLRKWVRENAVLFGAKDEKKVKQICNKFQDIAHAMKTGSTKSQSYKGWSLKV